jgi:putative transposase
VPDDSLTHHRTNANCGYRCNETVFILDAVLVLKRLGGSLALPKIFPPIAARPIFPPSRYCEAFAAMSHEQNTNSLPQRKHPAHDILVVDGEPTIIFDTVCTKDRVAWLANETVQQLLREVWLNSVEWLVGRYVIMPNHIHLFAAASGGSTVAHDPWVTYWKSQFTKRHRVSAHRWQTDCWDTRIRSPSAFEEKWEYVRNNPVRAGLVARAEDWPFQGLIFDYTWT